MSGTGTKDRACDICGKLTHSSDLRPYGAVRPGLSALITLEHPTWGEGKFICRDDLGIYLRRYVEKLLEDERGEIGVLEKRVLDSIETGELISPVSAQELADGPISFGDRMADRVAKFGGSWTFIMTFSGVLVVWIVLNTTGLLFRPFDLYPFILLNLLLSCIAAMQAPIIMMSRKRPADPMWRLVA